MLAEHISAHVNRMVWWGGRGGRGGVMRYGAETGAILYQHNTLISSVGTDTTVETRETRVTPLRTGDPASTQTSTAPDDGSA